MIEIESSELQQCTRCTGEGQDCACWGSPSAGHWLAFAVLAVLLVLASVALGVGLGMAQDWLRGVLAW